MADGVESIYIQICHGTPNHNPRRHDAPATPSPDIPPTPSTNYDGRLEANTGETILHIAVGNDKVEEVREILKDRKFEVNAENLRGETALEIAVKEKYRYIERLLMDNSQVSAFVDRLYRDRR
jgi:ankyrin repeat protein